MQQCVQCVHAGWQTRCRVPDQVAMLFQFSRNFQDILPTVSTNLHSHNIAQRSDFSTSSIARIIFCLFGSSHCHGYGKLFPHGFDLSFSHWQSNIFHGSLRHLCLFNHLKYFYIHSISHLLTLYMHMYATMYMWKSDGSLLELVQSFYRDLGIEFKLSGMVAGAFSQ